MFLDDFEDFDLFFWGDAEVILVIDELFIVFFDLLIIILFECVLFMFG